MFGFFHDSANIYIILEAGINGQLFKYLKKTQPISEAKTAFLMRQICSAVNELHSNQIIHRDLKPENIVVHDVFFMSIIEYCETVWFWLVCPSG